MRMFLIALPGVAGVNFDDLTMRLFVVYHGDPFLYCANQVRPDLFDALLKARGSCPEFDRLRKVRMKRIDLRLVTFTLPYSAPASRRAW